jgi:hypothetical protein
LMSIHAGFKGFPEPSHVLTHVNNVKLDAHKPKTKPGLMPGFCFFSSPLS